MKTFVTDDYQISIGDDDCDCFDCRIKLYHTICISYNPVGKGPTWSKNDNIVGLKASYNIFGLDLTKHELEVLHEALELVGKQDIMDNEIVLVNK